ncbi:MAG: hypothetical protein HY812_13490 [Planctomycetes bacterium]|nr:hypothetical protein [Planctomycetota bacterium]
MGVASLRRFAAQAAFWLVSCPTVLAGTPVIQGVTETSGTGEASFSFKIIPNGNTILDVHIMPEAKGKSLKAPKDSNNGSGVTMPAGWGFDSSGSGYHFYAETGAAAGGAVPEEGFTFKVVVKAKESPPQMTALFSLTNSGKKRSTSGANGDIVHGPTNTGQNDAGQSNLLKMPVTKASAVLNPGSNPVLGGFLLLDLETNAPHLAYTVYVSRSLAVDPADDLLSIGLNMNDVPPREWGLQMVDFRGAFTERFGRGRAQARLEIPDDEGLIGQTLHFVVALDDDHDGVPDAYSEPVTVTIGEE